LTGLDGLPGSRNASSGTTPPAPAAKDGSGVETRPGTGDSGSFETILSDLSRSDAPSADATTSAQGISTTDSSHISGLVNRISRAGSIPNQYIGEVRSDASRAESARPHEDGLDVEGENERPQNPGLREPGLSRRRSGLVAKPMSEHAGSDSVVGTPDQLGPAPGSGTSLAVAAQVGALPALPVGSSTGLVSLAPDPPLETSAGDRLCNADSANEALTLLATEDPPSQSQFSRQRAKSKSSLPDVGTSQLSTFVDVARKPESKAQRFAAADEHAMWGSQPREQVTVIAAETHFPVVVSYSPVDQIMQRLAAEFGQWIVPIESKRPLGSAQDGGPGREASTCVRSLTVLLEPAHLGPVTIKFRLVGTNLGLEIEADEQETTSLIGRGRHVLTEKLQALGLSVDRFIVSDNIRAPHSE
jgi:hypothetical protein